MKLSQCRDGTHASGVLLKRSTPEACVPAREPLSAEKLYNS